MLRKTGTPALLVLNKIDLVREKARLLPLIELYKAAHDFADYIPVSAARGKGLEVLRQAILDRLPEGPAYFPEDYVTDQPERFLAAELIREKVLAATRQEVPHSVAVMVDQLGGDAGPDPHLRHHPRGARRDRRPSSSARRAPCSARIGTLARKEMEKLFGVKIYLDLHVRVQPGWREEAAFLNTLDWRTMAVKDDS